ncbi:MAG: Hpt domain-containing protein [Bacteroidales bacterium]|nr:Hpt domain-containing protein [Bacteroidales bacterium]
MKEYKFINMDYVDGITDGNSEMKCQLIELFFEQIEEIKQKFSKAIKENDLDEIQKIAHLTKSTTKVMGINNISEKMFDLELGIKEKKENFDYKSYIDFFLNNISFAEEELKEELNQNK